MWRPRRGRGGQGFSNHPRNSENRYEGHSQAASQNRGYQNHSKENFQPQFSRGGNSHGGFAGRRTNPPNKQEMQQELSKPWVNPYLKKQILLKYRFKDASSGSKQLNDFEKFQHQRNTVENLTRLAREAYFRQNPDQESHWLSILASEHQNVISHCELCDEDFDDVEALRQHEGEHQTCGLEGCTFTAHARELEDHIFTLHASGLYRRMQVGNTAEEIEKWKADRKKNYPSVEKTLEANLKRKQIRDEKHQNYLARLEHQKKMREERERQKEDKESQMKENNKRKFEDDKDSRGLSKRKRTRKQKGAFDVRSSTDKADQSELRRRGAFVFSEDEDDEEGQNGGVEKFRGTKFYISMKTDFETNTSQDDLPVDDLDISDDDEWTSFNQRSEMKSLDNDEEKLTDSVQPVFEESALMETSPDSAAVKVDCLNVASNHVTDENDDDDKPTEAPIVKGQPQQNESKPVSLEGDNNVDDEDEGPSEVPIEKKALFKLESAPSIKPLPKPKKPDEPKFKLVRKPRRNPTLLENLLSSQICVEHSEILQCVRYVCENNFFGIGNK